jgi:hypothetical protein
MFPFAGVITASELDKQILRLYCSSYSRSWDTAQQTFDAIASAWVKKISIPSLRLNVKVGEYKNQLNFELNFDAGQALDNQLTGIQYVIYDSSGSIESSRNSTGTIGFHWCLYIRRFTRIRRCKKCCV